MTRRNCLYMCAKKDFSGTYRGHVENAGRYARVPDGRGVK